MTIRKIDDRVALIIVDFQEGTRRFTGEAGPAAYRAAAALAANFRARSLPVIVASMAGAASLRTDVAPDGRPFAFPPEARVGVPEIGVSAGDIRIERSAWSVFVGTDLANLLVGLEVTHVVLCGTAASLGVESSARDAYDLGLNVSFAVDAITDFDAAAFLHSVQKIFPLLGEVGQSRDVSALLTASEA